MLGTGWTSTASRSKYVYESSESDWTCRRRGQKGCCRSQGGTAAEPALQDYADDSRPPVEPPRGPFRGSSRDHQCVALWGVFYYDASYLWTWDAPLCDSPLKRRPGGTIPRIPCRSRPPGQAR